MLVTAKIARIADNTKQMGHKLAIKPLGSFRVAVGEVGNHLTLFQDSSYSIPRII